MRLRSSSTGDRLVGELARLMLCSSYVVVLTGAGMSAESGIPTFRGRDGLWRKVDPEKFTIRYFMEHPYEWWQLAVRLAEPFLKARPSRAHRILARLEKGGLVRVVITQNIDGLHQRAGSRNVIELHGSLDKLECPICHREYPARRFLRKVRRGIIPACEVCGAILKPSAVLFGEPIPRDAFDRALEHSRKADLFLVLGSSLAVEPAALLPELAKESGAMLAIINLDPTPLDSKANLVINRRIGEVLAKLERILKPFLQE